MEIGPSSVSDGEKILQKVCTVYYTLPPGWSTSEEVWNAGKVFFILDQEKNVRVSWRDKWEGASDDVCITLFEDIPLNGKFFPGYGSMNVKK